MERWHWLPPGSVIHFQRTFQCPRSKPTGARPSASVKLRSGHANRSHILTKMATKRKRNLRQTNHVRAEDAGRLDRMLPYL